MVLLTLRRTFDSKNGKRKVKMTQKFHEEYKFGHYHWTIEDMKGNILFSGFTTGGVKPLITESDVEEIYNRYNSDSI